MDAHKAQASPLYRCPSTLINDHNTKRLPFDGVTSSISLVLRCKHTIDTEWKSCCEHFGTARGLIDWQGCLPVCTAPPPSFRYTCRSLKDSDNLLVQEIGIMQYNNPNLSARLFRQRRMVTEWGFVFRLLLLSAWVRSATPEAESRV